MDIPKQEAKDEAETVLNAFQAFLGGVRSSCVGMAQGMPPRGLPVPSSGKDFKKGRLSED